MKHTLKEIMNMPKEEYLGVLDTQIRGSKSEYQIALSQLEEKQKHIKDNLTGAYMYNAKRERTSQSKYKRLRELEG